MLRTLLALLVAAAPAFAQSPGKRYALLVGGNKYENRNLPELNFAEADVTELGDHLKARGYEIALLLSTADGERRASKANIEARLEAVLKKTTKDDTLVVALAGHGLQFARPGGKEEAYYCPREAVPSEPDTLVSLSALLKRIGERGAGTNLILVDACRNDPDPNRSGIDGNAVGNLPEGTAILFSCARGQKALESSQAKHGLFFHFVLDGMKGKAANEDGEVTWNRLVTHVQEQLRKKGKDLVSVPVTQTPHGISNLAGSGIIAAAASGPPSSPPPPVADGANAQLRRGLALLRSDGPTRDPKAALAAIRAAAEMDHAPAQYYLGNLYTFSFGAVKVDRGEAMKWFRRAADAGYAPAQVRAGSWAQAGLWTEKAPADAQRWLAGVADRLKAAAPAGDPDVLYALGVCLADGVDSPRDSDEAARLFRRAAEAGEILAITRMGMSHAHPKNADATAYAEGLCWYRRATALGDTLAMTNLGFAYLLEKHVPKDPAEALRMFQQAADWDDPTGLLMVGECYAKGNGVAKDDAEAVRWFRKAAAKGNVGAAAVLKRLNIEP